MKTPNPFYDLPELGGKKTLLRALRLSDAEAVFEFTSMPETSRFLSWQPHLDIATTEAFLFSVLECYDRGLPAQWGVVELHTRRVVGIAGFIDFVPSHRRAEIAFVLSPKAWGRGYMTEAVTMIVNFGLTELGLVRIEAKCEPNNHGSARVLSKAGMQYEGLSRKLLVRKEEHRDFSRFAVVAGGASTPDAQ